jgi:hypothetical protein
LTAGIAFMSDAASVGVPSSPHAASTRRMQAIPRMGRTVSDPHAIVDNR